MNTVKTYAPKDRTNLNLPEEQTCDTCEQTKSHVEFQLKKKNQHTVNLPDELESTCKGCKEIAKKVINKGNFIKNASAGHLLLSDALIEHLTEDNGSKLKRLVEVMVFMAMEQDTNAMRMVMTLAQGKIGTVSVKGSVGQGEQSQESVESGGSVVPSTSDLLNRLK